MIILMHYDTQSEPESCSMLDIRWVGEGERECTIHERNDLNANIKDERLFRLSNACIAI